MSVICCCQSVMHSSSLVCTKAGHGQSVSSLLGRSRSSFLLRKPSPPTPRGWPLSWVPQAAKVSEDTFNELRGLDATVYIRFLRGCSWYTLIQTFTTLPILLPIHSIFSDGTVSLKSMTRASITSLVSTAKGQSLLWIHMLLLIWITASWIGFLIWLMKGAFRGRARNIIAAGEARARADEDVADYLHPHPRYFFRSSLPVDTEHMNRGLRLRTVMVTNIPPMLRTEKELKAYFEYYLCRRIAKPALGITATTHPGFCNKTFAFLYNKTSRVLGHWRSLPGVSGTEETEEQKAGSFDQLQSPTGTEDVPIIERVVLVRKMNELASLLTRREEYLRQLETAHIKLARRTLSHVKTLLEQQQADAAKGIKSTTVVGKQPAAEEGNVDSGYRDQLLVETLKPFVKPDRGRSLLTKRRPEPEYLPTLTDSPRELSPAPPVVHAPEQDRTIWDALLSLPRSTLEAFQPLTRLSTLYRGQVVPTIDFYTAKLQLLSSVITEKRGRAPGEYEAMSTAFVTFEDPVDARKACKYLAVHPLNPLQCFVTMAPLYEDLDWDRLMKPTFRVEVC